MQMIISLIQEGPIKLVHERFRNCYTFYPQNLVKNEEGLD